MPEKVTAKDVSTLKGVSLTITYDPKQINLRMQPKTDFIDRVNMSTNQFLNDLSDDFYGCYELTPDNQFIHAHVLLRTVRSSVIGKSKLLDGMFRKIKMFAQKYKYIGIIFLKLSSHYPGGQQGYIDYLSKEIAITCDACDIEDENYIKLYPSKIIIKDLNILDYFKMKDKQNMTSKEIQNILLKDKQDSECIVPISLEVSAGSDPVARDER